ncbi:hypothetical protein [Novosphingobium sp. 9]|nr:hypothetical protein [Novosphingobium sp. 9]
MAKVIALSRTLVRPQPLSAPADALRCALVVAFAAVVILARAPLPFL